jgi:glycosyltransferase involved in cell wall biosynthesis
MRFSHRRIVISRTIASLVKRKHGCESMLVRNGVGRPTLPASSDALRQFGLTPGRYVLMVSRLVPEKRHRDLIEAFSQASLPGWRLAIVGASDHPDAYSRGVEATAQQTPDMVMTGFQSGTSLRELYAHAGIFVLPSSHEGLPLALLEALSYGLPAIASDIPANLEVELPPEHYFPLGDVAALAERLRHFAGTAQTAERRSEIQDQVTRRFDWQVIAGETAQVYRSLLD